MPAERAPRLALALALLAGPAAGDGIATAPAAAAPAAAKPVPTKPALDAALVEFLAEFSADDGSFVDPFALDAVDAKSPPPKARSETAPKTDETEHATPPATPAAPPSQEKDHGH